MDCFVSYQKCQLLARSAQKTCTHSHFESSSGHLAKSSGGNFQVTKRVRFEARDLHHDTHTLQKDVSAFNLNSSFHSLSTDVNIIQTITLHFTVVKI